MLPGETSTRIVANYLRGRLPAIVDAYTNIVDVEDVADGAPARGRARAAPGERYILGGENLRWSEVIERIARISGVRHPLLVLPPEVAGVADALKRARRAVRDPRGHPADGARLALLLRARRGASSATRRGARTRRCSARSTGTTELIEDDRLAAPTSRSFDVMTAGVRVADRFGLLLPLRAAGQMAGRRTVL